MNLRVLHATLNKTLLYTFAAMVLAWLSQSFDVLPSALALAVFHVGFWLSLLFALFILPYTLFRFVRADSFDRWAYLGMLSAAPAMVVWLSIGPSNFTNPSLTDVTTDASLDIANELYAPKFDPNVQRQAYPTVQPWVSHLSKERLEQLITLVANDHDWHLVTKTEHQWVFQVYSPGLSYEYKLIVQLSPREYGYRIDARALTQEASRDFGFAREIILTLRHRFNDTDAWE
jgi:hypothetical protein